MSEILCPVGLPGPMRDALEARVRDRKNFATIMAFADWLFRMGLLFRSKKGVELVRGSHRKIANGLKERADLQELGLTADKIRGAIKALVEVCFLDVEVAEDTRWHMNFRAQPRRKPNLYRLTAEFRSIYYRACEAGAATRHWVKRKAVAAKHVASKLCSSAKTNLTAPVASFSSPLNQNQTLTGKTPSRGELPPANPPKPKLVPAEDLTDFDRWAMSLNAEVLQHAQAATMAEPVQPGELRPVTEADELRAPEPVPVPPEPEEPQEPQQETGDQWDLIARKYGLPPRPKPEGAS